MARLAEEMARLRDEIRSRRGSRAAFVRGLRDGRAAIAAQAAATLAAGRAQWREGARRTIRDVKARRAEIARQAGVLKRDVAEAMAGLRDRRVREASEQRNARQAAAGELRDGVARSLDASRRQRLQAAAGMRRLLRANRAAVGEQVSELAADRPGRQRAAVELKREVAELRRRHREELAETARTARAERLGSLGEIRASLASLLGELRGKRREVVDDLAAMRRMWNESLPADPNAVPGEPAGESEAPPGPDQAPSAGADDLTAISGIGPERSRSLAAAGISTFARLAESRPETLREAVHGPIQHSEIERWIRQARALGAAAAGKRDEAGRRRSFGASMTEER